MATKPKYEVLTGLDLPTGKRYEPGDIATDIPPGEIKWLREQGHIKLVGKDEPPAESEKEGDG